MPGFLLFIALLLSVPVVHAHRISGIVRDSIGDPIAGATISLLQPGDSTIVDARSADTDGVFSFDDIDSGMQYHLTVSCLGFKPFNTRISEGEHIEVRLASDEACTLGELKVTVARPTVRRGLGSFTISPNSYTALASNSYDLLGLMPMISRVQGGYAILGGTSATIYLNGRKPIMSQEQLKSYLSSVPPQNIREIVLIQDSGTSQRGSVINVILDRPDEGFLGYANLSVSAREDIGLTGSAMAYYTGGRIALSVQVHGGMGQETSKSQSDIFFKNDEIRESRYYKDKNEINSVNTDVQLQYSVTAGSYIGIFARIRNNFGSARNTAENRTFLPDGTEQWYSSGSRTYDRHHHIPATAVATYHLDLDKRGSYLEAVADIDYTRSERRQDRWGSNINDYSRDYDHKGFSAGVRADMVKYFAGCQLDAGYSFLNDGHQDITLDNGTTATDNYLYREFLHKGYVNFMHAPLSWLQYSLGLRLEDIHQHIEQRVERNFTKNSHFDILPDLSLSFFLPRSSQQIKASYKIELDRPRYFQMNPRKIWSSESSYSQGNPYLKPARCHKARLFYIWNYMLYGDVMFSYMNDYQTRILREASPGITENTYDNFGTFLLTQIRAGFQKVFFNRWQMSASTSAQYWNIDGGPSAPEMKSVAWFWGLELGNYVVISHRQNISASLSFTLTSPVRSLNYIYRWSNRIYLSIDKQFGRDWNLSLSADNFLPRNRKTIEDTPELYYESRNLVRQASISLSARYTFGNNTVRKVRTNMSSSVSDRK